MSCRGEDPLETYEEWDMTIPPLPPRSRLYRLEPIGIGTPYTESLTGYIVRLAEAHHVDPRVLITQEILGSLRKLPGLEHKKKTFPYHTLNGTGERSNDCVRVLEMLTQYSGLCFLTMITWSEVIAYRMLRITQSWCPACYEEWREMGQIIYHPLIWSLQAVAICPRHRQPLRSTCPHENCQRSLPFIPIGSRLGYCSYCKRWLGIVSESNDCDNAASEQRMDRLYWDATAVGDLIAKSPSVMIPLERERISFAIKGLSERITDENTSFLAYKLGISDSSMNNWLLGTQIPQLAQLLQLCFGAGLSLFQFLTVGGGSSPVISTASVNRGPLIIERGRHKRLIPDELRGLLENALLEDPPPSLNEVALRLGYRSSGHLSRRFPDLRRAIGDRYRRWLSSSSGLKSQMRKPLKGDELKKMLEAVLDNQEIPPPSLQEVARRLGYRSFKPIRRRYPDLCRSITAKRRENQEHFNQRMRQSLEAVLKEPQGPIPSLVEIAEQLGCSTSILYHRFPKLCKEISVRYREQLKEQRSRVLQDIITSDNFPPLSLEDVAKRLDCSTDTLHRIDSDICDAIIERYQSYVMARKVERDQRVVSEIREAVNHLYSEGVYPGMRKVEAITRQGYMIEPLAANAWREALKELGLRNLLD